MNDTRLKGLMVILDGLGDRPKPELGGRTPLEAAHTPHLDRVLALGCGAQVDPLEAGMPVGTHTGTSLLMGLPPREAYSLSRGPVEAVGIDLPVRSGDVLMRCNFATVVKETKGLRIVDRRAGRISEGTEALAAELQRVPLADGIFASLYPATQHRAVLRLQGSNLSPAIGNTDPGTQSGVQWVRESVAYKNKEAAVATAAALNEFIAIAHQRLSAHEVNLRREQQGLPPANAVITRGAGALNDVHNYLQHLGVKTAVVSGERTVLGLAKLFGFSPVTSESFTSLPDTDLAAKVASAQQALATHDMVYLHIKGTDISSHDCDPELKRQFIERIDAALGPLFDEKLVIGVSADHSTDSSRGCHCGDPVPSLLYAPDVRRDEAAEYGERQCMKGGLGRIGAHGFMLHMLDYMGWLHNYMPKDAPFLRGGG